MKKYIKLFIKIFSILAIVGFLFLSLGKSLNISNTNDQNAKTDDTDVSQNINTTLVSGPENNLPWDFEMEFIKSKELNNTPVLMGAYRTVLRDPLPGEEFNVHLAARMLCGIVLEPGQIFSQNGTVGPYTEERGFQKGPTYIGSKLTTTIGGGVCKIASTLYNVSVLSNLKIVERHNHSMPVPYVPYGQDATVSYGAKDFKFKNDTEGNVMIWAQGVDNILYMGFYGTKEPPSIRWNHEVLKKTAAQKVYKVNPTLPKGYEKVLIDGMDGAMIKSSLTIEHVDGTTINKEMGISNYSPFPTLIEKGP
ncbi:VanW family protein [Pseudobacteroides cellulosolvens]|uniref:VanW family protein n=1 Tax=Pseudobacteroides cellulosolvens ATCC 35603 = DSM 2933 TaxID=398512 RepID=A0A0L6JKG6_9FIRM|nr:VanW family protein [Pseudobacteroides cellulosolvens]KNY26245.1 VanW family protein [Pseudobacteroides cellulosolvens ATCC 35603 = DSM 2933]